VHLSIDPTGRWIVTANYRGKLRVFISYSRDDLKFERYDVEPEHCFRDRPKEDLRQDPERRPSSQALAEPGCRAKNAPGSLQARGRGETEF
jgi:hypothetical protein